MAALGLIGSIIGAVGTIMTGQAQAQMMEYQARQLEVKAAEERAAAQREAIEQGKETEYVISRQRAVAGVSGLGVLDDTVLQLVSDTAGAGKYRQLMTQYGGLSRAEGLRAEAAGKRMSGRAALIGSYFGAAGQAFSGFGTIMGSGTSLFGKYGGAGPGEMPRFYYG